MFRFPFALSIALFGLSMLPGPSHAQQVEKKPAELLSGAPASLRPYLMQALAADNIADPLTRCLAVPDLPGNAWPAGMSAAQCKYHRGPRIAFAELKVLVQNKAFAELDARFGADLVLHSSKEHFSEAIHWDFDGFDGGPESELVSKAWLEGAPESAFALAARGTHYHALAGKLRGTEYVSKTPADNFMRMGVAAELATELLEQSIQRAPSLIHSHTSLMGLHLMASDKATFLRAFQRASAIDPTCRMLATVRMDSLKPRWGGSYSQMEAHAEILRAHVKDRPLLANAIAEIEKDKALSLVEDDRYAQAVAMLKPATLRASDPHLHARLAINMAHGGDADRWTALAHLIQQARFIDELQGLREQGRILLNEGEIELAAKALRKALKADPSDPDTRFWMATASIRLQRLDEAEQMLLPLADNAQHRKQALIRLLDIAMASRNADKVLASADIVNKEHPAYAKAWYARAVALNMAKKPGLREALQRIVDTADPKDAVESRMAAEAAKRLKQMDVKKD